MNKEHVTKGPVTAERMLIGPNDKDRRSGYVVNGPDPEGGGLPVRICDLRSPQGMNGTAKAEANAELIAEAFNVLHDTGYTPAELVKILKDAHEAMGKVAAMCQVHNPHTGFLNDVNPYDAYRILLPSMVKAGEVFAKYQPVTPA